LRGGGVLALEYVLDEDAALSDFLVDVEGLIIGRDQKNHCSWEWYETLVAITRVYARIMYDWQVSRPSVVVPSVVGRCLGFGLLGR
jgi:hypothetical protein